MTFTDFFIVFTGWAIGNYIFNNFEKHLPWWRRLLKLFVMAIAQTLLHAYWFPKHGINGLTAEPYDKYLELIRKTKRITSRIMENRP